jgi:cystathionine beta-lyase/cystathionine gamma-synthase
LVFPASVFYSAHKNNIKTIPFNMIRIYVGLEEADLLIEDIDLALNSI